MRSAATSYEQLAEQLADAGRLAVERGLVVASGGNLSARLGGAGDFLVTASGTWLDRLGPGDFTRVGIADGAVVGGASTPSVEWKLHQRTYQERADVNAVVHLHPQHAVLVDALGHHIRLLTLDHVVYVRSVARVPFLPAGSQEVADASAEAARECDAILLAHHGCSTLGDTVGMALRRAMNLEEAAAATYRCLAVGDTEAAFPTEWLGRLDSV